MAERRRESGGREDQSDVGGDVGWWLKETVLLSWWMIVFEGIERSEALEGIEHVCLPSRHGQRG